MSHTARSVLALGTAAVVSLSVSACSSLLFGNRTQATNLVVGQCILVPINSQVNSVATTDCTEEHTGEVYSISPIDGESLPSRDELEELVDDTCYSTFEAYVGSSPEDTSLDYTAMSPTADTWAKGDRTIVCIAVPTETDTLSRSVKDSRM